MTKQVKRISVPQPRRRAFTLVEMLVVIGIIVLVLGLSVPTMRTMSKGSTQQQGRNMVSSVLASARATAVNMHTPVTAVFYEESGANRSSAILIYQNSSGTFDSVMSSVDQSLLVPFRLPMGMKIAALDSGTLQTDAGQGGTLPCRMVSFNEQGQVIAKQMRLNVSTYDASTAYKLGQFVTDGTTVYQSIQASNTGHALNLVQYWNKLNWTLDASNNLTGYSAPVILIYDGADLAKAGGKDMSDTDRADWLTKNGTLMVLNAYTGNTIR